MCALNCLNRRDRPPENVVEADNDGKQPDKGRKRTAAAARRFVAVFVRQCLELLGSWAWHELGAVFLRHLQHCVRVYTRLRSFRPSRRQLGSYSLTFRICPPGQRLSAPLVPLERFAIRLKKRGIANQAIRIETTSLLETKEFCGAAWPSK